MRPGPILWIVILATGAGPLLAADAKPAEVPIAERLRIASDARHRDETHPKALKLCEEVIASAKADAEDKIAAFEIIIDVLRREKKYDEAVVAAARMGRALADNRAAQQQACFIQAEIYSREIKKNAKALETLREFIARAADDKPGMAEAHLRIAEILQAERKFTEAYDEAAKTIDLDPQDDQRVAGALWRMMDAAWNEQNMTKAEPILKRLLEDRYLSHRGDWERRDARMRYSQCLRKLKRYDQARAHHAAMEKAETDPRQAQEWCYLTAETFAEENRLDDAVKAYERVFTDHPDCTQYWHEAQRQIADLLVKTGRLADALQAARLCLDASWDEGKVVENVRRVAEILKGLDNHVARANAFIDFQRFGPDGEDGKAATADDLKDPLAAVGYARNPAREKALEEACRRAGDDGDAVRLRAFSYIFTGRPAEALRCFVDVFARSTGSEFEARGREMIVIGVRAARGHAVGLDAFFQFVNYGPAGPDGKAGTAADLADPFAPLLK